MKIIDALTKEKREAIANINATKLPIKMAWDLKKAIGKINRELKTYEELRKETLAKYAKKDEHGQMVVDSKGMAEFEKEEDHQAFLKQLAELQQKDIEIKVFNFKDLGDIWMAPKDLLNLEGVLFEKVEED